MKKVASFFLILTVSISILNSQNKIVEGRVLDDNLEILPAVQIFIKDTIEIGKTDFDGFFQIEVPISENKLLFEFVGIDPATINLVENCDEVEVIMMLTGTYDFMSLKRAEKKRKKRFKMLPELHKQAFEIGLFKSEESCYNRDFEPYFLDSK